MTNNYPGLARGPIDHNASSVINIIANEALNMGDAVALVAGPATELLPRVDATDAQGEEAYGVVVAGDADGVYGTGAAASDDTTRAATAAGEAVVVVTRGRCLARVTGTISVGTKLTPSATVGALEPAIAGDIVIATALQASTTLDVSAVDVDPVGVL